MSSGMPCLENIDVHCPMMDTCSVLKQEHFYPFWTAMKQVKIICSLKPKQVSWTHLKGLYHIFRLTTHAWPISSISLSFYIVLLSNYSSTVIKISVLKLVFKESDRIKVPENPYSVPLSRTMKCKYPLRLQVSCLIIFSKYLARYFVLRFRVSYHLQELLKILLCLSWS